MIVDLVEILKLAQEKQCAVGAFNTPTLEALSAVLASYQEQRGRLAAMPPEFRQDIEICDLTGDDHIPIRT